MKFKRYIPVILAVLLLTAAVFISAKTQKKAGSDLQTSSEASHPEPDEMRGVWVTYMTLDVENETDKQAAFEKKIDTIVKDMTDGGFNTMIVQVRPFCDALYPSQYFPWSHIISGEQGVDPGFDPLQLIIDKCRANGLFIHAWINPYRVATENRPSVLSADNPVIKDESLGVRINGRLFLNPASEKAIALIAAGVKELVDHYDIDGIQFDDYFYPSNCGNFDQADYEAYLSKTGNNDTIGEFRRNNVNRMVAASYTAAHLADSGVLFGISPQGNFHNNANLYADVEKWCGETGYIDYICPQLYYSPDNPLLTFEDSLDEWVDMKKHDGLRVYGGLAAYKAGTDADSGTWLDNDDILLTEVDILRKSDFDGFILFSSDSFHSESNQTEVQNLVDYLKSTAVQQSLEASVISTS